MVGKEDLTWTKVMWFIFAFISVAIVTSVVVISCMNTNDGTDIAVSNGNATQVVMPFNFSRNSTHNLSNISVMVTMTSMTDRPSLDVTYPDCGGVVIVPMNGTAYINYKNGSFYSDDERCVWIVTSEARYVQFKFIEETLSVIPSRARSTWTNVEDGITVGTVNNGNLTCTKLARYDYKTPMIVATPFLLYFTSNGFLPGYMSWYRAGFVMQLQSHIEKAVNVIEGKTLPRTLITSSLHGELELSSTPMSYQGDNLLLIAVFTRSLSLRTSKKTETFRCLPETTASECCGFVSGFHLKPYHEGGPICTQASSLPSSQSAKDAFVVLFHPPLSVNESNCKLTWT